MHRYMKGLWPGYIWKCCEFIMLKWMNSIGTILECDINKNGKFKILVKIDIEWDEYMTMVNEKWLLSL